ncbi:uncharacterized protein LOC141949211 [Strix uralensis]|uniref:uncharacterized protein LOC141949211 n=1 Tax=Strix uralensis TaxID=36305 RepID=UPI003DA3B391
MLPENRVLEMPTELVLLGAQKMESLPCSKEYMLLPSCAAEAESKAGQVHRGDQMRRGDRDAHRGAEGGPGFLQGPRGRRREETSSPASVPWPAWTSSFTCNVKLEAEEKGVYGSAAFPPFLKKMIAVQGGDGPQGKTRPLTESKPKLTIKEEILEKHGDLMEASPPDLTCPSAPTSPLQKSFAVPYEERGKLLHIKQEDVTVGDSSHTCLLKEQLGTLSSTSPANGASHCLKAETPVAQQIRKRLMWSRGSWKSKCQT